MFTELHIWQYLDGEMNPDAQKAFEKALTEDSALRRQTDEIKSLRAALQTLSPEQPSMRFTQNVMDAVARHEAVRKMPALLSPRTLRLVLGSIAAGMAALIVWSLSQPAAESPYAGQVETALSRFEQLTGMLQNPLTLTAMGVALSVIVLYFADGLLKQRQLRV